MFVSVTVLCCWLGYEFNWIRQRKEFRINYMAERQRHRPRELDPWEWTVHALPDIEAPFALNYFGEAGERAIKVFIDAKDADQVTTIDKQRRRRAQALFPEAVVDFVYWGFGDEGERESAEDKPHFPHFWIIDHRDVPNLDR
jgi:hypothetical protein